MATLSDENASNIGKSIKEAISALLRVLLRSLANKWQQRAERNFKKLEKNHPERIRTADIETKDLDKFKILAQQQGIKLYQIEQEKHKTPTLKYDIRDEHKIVGIFKQLEEGYKIPENQLMALMEKHFDTQKLINRISRITGLDESEVEKELKNSEHYQDENLFGKDFQDKIQEMYDKGFKEVVGKENKESVMEDIEPEIPVQEKDELEIRLEKLKEKREKTQAPDKEKSKQRVKQKVADKGRER